MDNYQDIIDEEYPRKSNRPKMTMQERAAQFAPFAALTGFSEVISDATERQAEELS